MSKNNNESQKSKKTNVKFDPDDLYRVGEFEGR